MDEGQNSMGGEKSGSGLKIAVVVILVLIVLAGLYFWSRQGAGDDAGLNGVLDNIGTQSDSDDPDAIKADLESTDVENLDMEFNAS